MTKGTSIQPRHEENRARVRKLIDGTGHPKDLSDLLLVLRHDTFSYESILDLGDFTAHNVERGKGAAHRHITDQMSLIGFITWFTHDPDANFPPFAKAAYRASLRTLGPQKVKEVLGIKMPKAQQLLDGFLDKLEVVEDGNLALSSDPSDEEKAVAKELTGRGTVKACYTQDQLTNDFKSLLEKHNLLLPEEKETINTFSDRLSIYAIHIMHRVQIPNPFFGNAVLFAGDIPESQSAGKRYIGVDVRMTMPIKKDGQPTGTFDVMQPMLTTSLGWDDCVASEEISSAKRPPNNYIDSPLELGGDWKLRSI